MKTIKDNSLIKWIIEKIDGKICVSRKPERRKVRPTKRQRKVQKRFLQAVKYAKTQMLDEDMKAIYQRGITKKHNSAYSVAFSDALIAPTVESIDTHDYYGEVGDEIVISAYDDFEVSHVTIVIKDGDGTEIERGHALPSADYPWHWQYETTIANRKLIGTTISATAVDLPGNCTTLTTVINHPLDLTSHHPTRSTIKRKPICA